MYLIFNRNTEVVNIICVIGTRIEQIKQIFTDFLDGFV